MAYSSSNIRAILELGFSDAQSMYLHRSSDAAEDIVATGYFAGAGAGSRQASSDSGRAHGMTYGSVILNVESSLGATPGRATLHAVIGSTANQASTLASTGWLTEYNVSVSAHPST